MLLVGLGLVLIALKLLAFGPVEDLSWGWVLSPLALAFVWFEFGERLFGRDRRRDADAEPDHERRRRQRLDAAARRDRTGR